MFHSLNGDLHSISANLENSAVAIALEKVRFHSSCKEGQCQRMFKLPCNCSLHVLGRLCSKSFKLGFNNMWTKNYQDIHVVFRKGRATRDQIFNIHWIMEKAMEFQKKHLLLLYWLCKAFGWITVNRGKFLKIGVQDHLICLLRNLYAGQEATVGTGYKQLTCSKLGKEFIKAVYCHPVYLTYMQRPS